MNKQKFKMTIELKWIFEIKFQENSNYISYRIIVKKSIYINVIYPLFNIYNFYIFYY